MRLLVTGANGFVGSALCRELAARGVEFLGATRRPLADVSTYVHGELDGHTNWLPALNYVDVVVHLAARVHVMRDAAADPLAEFRRTNVEATLNLARQAANKGVKRFVFVSSIKVNGEYTAEGEAFCESSAPQPEDPYALSKWEAERALLALGVETGLQVVIVRPPLIYGPGVRANFLQLMNWVSKGRPLPFARIVNKRSLLFVGNLVDALIVCASHPAAAGETYLLDDGIARSSSELVAAVAGSLGVPNRDLAVPVWGLRAAAALLGRRAAVERLTYSLVVNSRKIRHQLGWQPPFDFDQGLKTTAEWFTARGFRALS